MSATIIFGEIYGPVILASLLAGVSYVIREVRLSRKESRRQLDTLVADVRELKQTDTHLRQDVDRLLREFPPVKEGLAILAAEFERHEQWHERGH